MTTNMSDDPARLAALRRYDILDTPREPGFDQLVELAAHICRAPVAVIGLVADRRLWFKAQTGLGFREAAIEAPDCRRFLLQPGVTVVPDILQDPQLRANPLFTAAPGLRFYAGCLLRSTEGHGLGVLCVLDRQPRDLDDGQRFALQALADQVMSQMELRRALGRQKLLAERQELLLKEVNHRIKNNLQLVSSIVSLQLRSIEDAAARSALLDTSHRIRSIAAVHDRLYQTDGPGMVDLAVFLQALAADLQASAPDGTLFEIEAVPVAVTQDVAVAMALMVNELVTNVLKYAYADGEAGPVQVGLGPTGDGRYRITVGDRGRGLPPDFDARRSRSLGMRIIFSLAQQIGAEVSIANGLSGTSSTVVFDVPQAPDADAGADTGRLDVPPPVRREVEPLPEATAP
ncbi:sensor histidine kinase [Arenibaculum sp.]|uniref:sensor histidine kinase n=1 Tax=Arenibaculum sp. TaxID=2865862 RepID=UPI002E0DE32D|nr:histidine kinase dimerization/phosphoacceptor domain -containing protein [Arenibaculum sp.]